MGFDEVDPEQVRAHIQIKAKQLISKINNEVYQYGQLQIVSLEKLRASSKSFKDHGASISLSEIVGDIQDLHKDQANNGALFQVASQFNLLEMISSSVTPEKGVDIYEGDHTQGPACAVACGAGTIYRNYFVPVNGQTGQSSKNQIDCLKDIAKALGNDHHDLWQMENGYLMTTQKGLNNITDQIKNKTAEAYENLKGKLSVGIQWDTEVTLAGTDNIVVQVFCSAIPVSYNHLDNIDDWEIFAKMILEATYEATFYTAMLNYEKTGNNKVFLTLVGGGAFGNKKEWIIDSIKKVVLKFINTPLDVRIVSYKYSNPDVIRLINTIRNR